LKWTAQISCRQPLPARLPALRNSVPHEFRHLSSLPHAALTQILVVGGAMSIIILSGLGYLAWRDRRRKISERRPPTGRRRKRRPKRPG
jgi:hypothetical protein